MVKTFDKSRDRNIRVRRNPKNNCSTGNIRNRIKPRFLFKLYVAFVAVLILRSLKYEE